MALIETIEGTIGRVWYHYDVAGDVLYLRLVDRRDVEALGEETDDGMILLRAEPSNQPVGLTVVNWWKRFGNGELPDSLREIRRRIEPLNERIAARSTTRRIRARRPVSQDDIGWVVGTDGESRNRHKLDPS